MSHHPSFIIEQSLTDIGLKLLSPIYLRGEVQDPQYAQVLSFRRQIYFVPADELLILKSILLKYIIENFTI